MNTVWTDRPLRGISAPTIRSTSCAAVLLCAVILLSILSCSRQPRYASPPVTGDEIVIEIASLPLDTPEFFTLRVEERPVSFFVIRYADRVRSYFDACTNCYQQKMGYGYEKGQVVCRSCGTTYSIHKLDRGLGGCYPIALAGTVKDGTYRIPLSAVKGGASKF